METRWLKEALFNGMTANSFKLGTVLSSGWFWQRIGGCHNVYRGENGEMDYDNVAAVMDIDDEQVTIVNQALPASTIWHYIRRQVSGCGLESEDSEACIVEIDENANMIGNLPNEPLCLSLQKLSTGKFRIRWRYSTIDQQIAPAGFYVYIDSGAGFDFDDPDATISYGGGAEFSYTTGSLVGGQVYRFCVRSYVSTRQTANTDYVSGVADDTGPEAATGLIAELEEI